MARTREKRGRYTCHNTPGDGTGQDYFPRHSPYSILKDAAPDPKVAQATKDESGTTKKRRA